jgi:hypothetical protein
VERGQVTGIISDSGIGWLVASPRKHGLELEALCAEGRHRPIEIAYHQANLYEPAPGLAARIDRIVLLHELEAKASALKEFSPCMYTLASRIQVHDRET